MGLADYALHLMAEDCVGLFGLNVPPDRMNVIAKQPRQDFDELLDWLRLRTLRDKGDLYTLGAALDYELGIA